MVIDEVVFTFVLKLLSQDIKRLRQIAHLKIFFKIHHHALYRFVIQIILLRHQIHLR